jgi:Meckel syndrome type 1 protein
MTTPLPPQEPEKLPGEAELAALYHKLPQAEPGPALDQAVLRAAAQALADEGRQAPAAAPVHRRPRWPIAWGSAAALVLAAGLAWHMREMPEAAAPATQGASADATRKEAAPLPAPVADTEPLPSPSLPLPPARRAATPVKPHEQARKTIVRPAAKPQVMRQAVAPPPRPPPPPVEETVEPAPAPAPALALPAPPPAPAAPPAPPATITSFATEGPAAELQAIRALFAAGRDKEGRERLVRFHEAHPGWSLPDDLRTRLPKP